MPERPVRDAGTMRRLSLAVLVVVAACGDDDAAPRAPADAGSDAGPSAPDASPEAGPSEPTSWHLERPFDSKRAWMVSPAGERVFVLGVNTTLRDVKVGAVPSCNGLGDWLRRAPPSQVAHMEWARLSTGTSGAETAAKPYGFNSVGAFSETNDLDATSGDSYIVRAPAAGGAGAPYSIVVAPVPRGDDRALKDATGAVLVTGLGAAKVGDPWNPKFLADLDDLVSAELAPRRKDPRLQVIYAGNETGMFDLAQASGGLRDFRRWIWSDCPAESTPTKPKCAPHALVQLLHVLYPDVAALNAAWESAYASFEAILTAPVKPVPYVAACNLACREDLQRFVHDRLVPEWVSKVTFYLRTGADGHVVAAPRLALGSSASFRFWSSTDTWADSGDAIGADTAKVKVDLLPLLARFDLVPINVYTGAPTFEEPWLGDGLRKLAKEIELPIMVSEMGTRVAIDGWSNAGGAGAFVATQTERGERYASQVAQLVAHPAVVGLHWHAWSDRYVSTDTSLQLNLGLVQCTDPARAFTAGTGWLGLDDRVAKTNQGIVQILAASTGL